MRFLLFFLFFALLDAKPRRQPRSSRFIGPDLGHDLAGPVPSDFNSDYPDYESDYPNQNDGNEKDESQKESRKSVVSSGSVRAGIPSIDHSTRDEPNDLPTGQDLSLGTSAGTSSEEKEDNCYFHKKRMSRHEKGERPKNSKVSENCQGLLMSMETLIHETDHNLFEAQNKLDLVLCRGAGNCDLDFGKPETVQKWSSKKICEKHKNELLDNWHRLPYNHILYRRDQKRQRREVCSMTENLGNIHSEKHSPFTRPVQLLFLTKREANAILEQDHKLYHAGIPLCEKHKQYAMSAFSQDHLQDRGYQPDPPPKDGFLSHSNDIDDESHNSCKVSQNDPEYHPPRVYARAKRSDVSIETQKAFFHYADTMNEKRLNSNKPFKELSQRSKNRKVASLDHMLDTSCAIVAPDSPEALKLLVIGRYSQDMWCTQDSHVKVSSMMNQVTKLYLRADTRSERLSILSVVAADIPLTTLQQYIPGLSSGLYYEARKLQKVGLVRTVSKRSRSDPEKINLFIEFITSNAVVSTFTYGTRHAKLDSGEKIDIPNHSRKQGATEIIEMYEVHMKQRNLEYMMLSKSTLYRILQFCPAGKQVALACVDYYLADVLEAVDLLHKIVGNWKETDLITAEKHKYLLRGIDENIHYQKTDYRIHLKAKSKVGDHCMVHALSDPDNAEFHSDCDHSHDVKCDRCELSKNFQGELVDQAKYFIEEHENGDPNVLNLLKDDLTAILSAHNKLLEFKKHVLRSKYTDDYRTEIISNLQEGEALVTMDFAQKLLPMKRYETQQDYFGKRGMSYHVTHVIANISNHYVTHNIIHILEDESQDHQVVTAIIAQDLQILNLFGVTSVSLRSDNAGCYHSAHTIRAVSSLSADGTTVKRYTFSEPQNGKGSCDRVASQVKRRVRDYVDSGHDVTTTAEFFSAITDRNKMKATSIFLSEVRGRRDKKDYAKTKSIPQMSLLFDFEYNGKEIIARRYHRIGTGSVIPVGYVPSVPTLLTVSHTVQRAKLEDERAALIEGRYQELLFWNTGKCKQAECHAEATTTPDEIDTPETIIQPKAQDKIFRCPEVGCSSSFIYYGSLVRHMEIGKHNIAPERTTFRDYTLRVFMNKLEDLSPSSSTNPMVAEMIGSIEKSDQDELIPKTEGWGLKTTKKTGKFPEHVRDYLVGVFDDGVTNKKKKTGKEVAERMKLATNSDGTRKFTAEDVLTARQIDSFFSREAQARRQEAVGETTRSRRSLGDSRNSTQGTSAIEIAAMYSLDGHHFLAMLLARNFTVIKGKAVRPKRQLEIVIGGLDDIEDEYSTEYEVQYLKDPATSHPDWFIWDAIKKHSDSIFATNEDEMEAELPPPPKKPNHMFTFW